MKKFEKFIIPGGVNNYFFEITAQNRDYNRRPTSVGPLMSMGPRMSPRASWPPFWVSVRSYRVSVPLRH